MCNLYIAMACQPKYCMMFTNASLPPNSLQNDAAFNHGQQQPNDSQTQLHPKLVLITEIVMSSAVETLENYTVLSLKWYEINLKLGGLLSA